MTEEKHSGTCRVCHASLSLRVFVGGEQDFEQQDRIFFISSKAWRNLTNMHTKYHKKRGEKPSKTEDTR